MSKQDLSFYIVDIFIAIDKIRRYTETFSDAQSLLYDELHWDATIRELEIIGEATNVILKITNDLSVEKRRIVDFRNQIIHGYFGINEDIVWDIIDQKISQLSDDLLNMVKQEPINIDHAIKSAEIENAHNPQLLNCLKEIKTKVRQ